MSILQKKVFTYYARPLIDAPHEVVNALLICHC